MKRKKSKQTWILKVVKELKTLNGGKCSADVGRCCKQTPPHSPLRRSAEAVCLWLQQHCCHGVASLLPAEDSLVWKIRSRFWRLFEYRFWPHVFLQTLGPKQRERRKMFNVYLTWRSTWTKNSKKMLLGMSINVPPRRKLVITKVELNLVLVTQPSAGLMCLLFCLFAKETVQKDRKKSVSGIKALDRIWNV